MRIKIRVGLEGIEKFRRSVETALTQEEELFKRFGIYLNDVLEILIHEAKENQKKQEQLNYWKKRKEEEEYETRSELNSTKSELRRTAPMITVYSTDSEGNTTSAQESNSYYYYLSSKVDSLSVELIKIEEQHDRINELIRKYEQRKEDIKNTQRIINENYGALNDTSKYNFFSISNTYTLFRYLLRIKEDFDRYINELYGIVEAYRDARIAFKYYSPQVLSTSWVGYIPPINIGVADDVESYTTSKDDKKLYTPMLLENTMVDSTSCMINGKTYIASCNIDIVKERLLYMQGDNCLGISKDCGLLAIVNNYRKTGTLVSENEIVKFATESKLCSENGGTTTDERLALLSKIGIQCDMKSNPSIEDVAKGIELGKALVLSINKESFDEIIDGEHEVEDIVKDFSVLNNRKVTNHCVMPYATYRDENGELGGIIICDSSGNHKNRAIALSVAGFHMLRDSIKNMKLVYSKKAFW